MPVLLAVLLLNPANPAVLTVPESALVVPPPTISEMITDAADKYDVSEKTMRRVIDCESGYNKLAIGDSGKSHGLVQINLRAHPNISKTQAQDPEFAINFLAKNLAAGNGKIWSCF